LAFLVDFLIEKGYNYIVVKTNYLKNIKDKYKYCKKSLDIYNIICYN